MTEKKARSVMKQRMFDNDYRQPRIYMITLATEGRQPVLGTLAGNPLKRRGEPGGPRFVPSALGFLIAAEVEGIPHFYPQIQVIAKQLMPDHLHMLLYVREPLPVHLGKVVNGFKVGCNRAYKHWLQSSPSPRTQQSLHRLQSSPSPHTQQQPQQQSQQQQQSSPSQQQSQPQQQSLHRQPDGGIQRQRVLWSAAVPQVPSEPRLEQPGLLWEHGYHDRVLSRDGQLQALIDYIHDNPRRLLIKRQHSDYFRQKDIAVAGMVLHAMGNSRLLQLPRRVAVRLSRHFTHDELQRRCAELLEEARQGAVLVSPFISPGERLVERLALAEGLPLVRLMDTGFSPFYKPDGRYFETCAAGTLLLLTPFEFQSQRTALSRQTCEQLNELATKLCLQ